LLWLSLLVFLFAFYQLGRVYSAPLLAYSSSVTYQNADIVLADVPSRMRVNVTNHETTNDSLQWSMDGRYLVFRSTRETFWTFFALDTESWSIRQLASFDRETSLWSLSSDTAIFMDNYSGEETIIILSPGEERLSADDSIFTCNPPNCYIMGAVVYRIEARLVDAAVYVELVEVDWETAGQLSFDQFPLWSRDGERFIFKANVHGQSDIYMGTREAGFAQRLTNSQEVEEMIAWSSDNRWISFTIAVGGRSEVFVLELATGEISNISQNPRPDFNPFWQP
jgi:Tol biopolymer transport system component